MAALLWSNGSRADDFEFFEQKIRPIFSEHCYSCHSATAEKVRGGLLLDSKEGVLKGGESGPAIVPGSPESSLLIKAVRYTDIDLQMPPKDKKLSESQINSLVEWVRMGAPDPRSSGTPPKIEKSTYDFAAARTNWAFHPPQDPPVPKVSNRKWIQSPIDAFVLAQLEKQKLKPAVLADKRTLIRRATFDLTGLPPTPLEIDAFLKDSSTNAYAKLIDRLLASPHYGERWARHWLDVVRYADSVDARVTGGPEDFAEAWRYRDWVVNAFNGDLPYNQFVEMQIAGDILSDTKHFDTNAIIATGMYAIGNWGNGDADKDKILTDIADDAVDVTGRAFLGLTLACARCHDHKFDPIPTADYYSLAGIFFSSHIIPKLSPKGSGETMLRIPLISETESEKRKARETRMVELEKSIEKIQDDQINALSQEVLPHLDRYLKASWEWQHRRPDDTRTLIEVATAQGLKSTVLQRWMEYLNNANLGLFSQPVRDVLGNKGLSAWHNAANADTPSVTANATDLEASFLTIKLPAHRISVHPSPKDGVAAAWKSPINGLVQIHGRVVDVDPNCGDGVDWELVKNTGGATETLVRGSIPSGGKEQVMGMNGPLSVHVRAGDSLQLNVLPKNGYECDSTMLELEIAEVNDQKRMWDLNRDVANDLLASNPHADSFGNADVWYFRDLAEGNLKLPAESALSKLITSLPLKNLSATEVEKAASKVQSEITNVFEKEKNYEAFVAPRGAFWAPLRNNDQLFSAEARARFQTAKKELADLRANPPSAVAMANGLQEGGVPESPHAGVHDVKIHIRGRYDRLGDLAPRRFPRLLAGEEQQIIKEGSGRLQLAKWIASERNPLAARVMINRIWQQHFGEGIVRTPNNYGKLGTSPTHPELLDFLAHRFVESGWSIKAMHRAIMLSATYQQSCVAAPETLKADPDNHWFGRMNRRRLDAESLRDSLLSVGGNLNLALGGPSIRELNNNRRTLYLMSIRSDRSNYKALFDAADPNAIVEQRVVSTVAPQALFLLNHPFAIAQTEALVQRVLLREKTSDKNKIDWLYRNLYGRIPSRPEIKTGRSALKFGRDTFGKDEKRVWTQYCQVLLCANEFVYVD